MVSTQGLVATITDGVDRELEETGGRSPSPSLERELGINKALKSALPKTSPPRQQVPQGCVPVSGRRGALGRERAECAARESPRKVQMNWGFVYMGIWNGPWRLNRNSPAEVAGNGTPDSENSMNKGFGSRKHAEG